MKLYPYQETGAQYLAHNRRAYLGDDPGLGKTVMAADAARRLGYMFSDGPVLVVCPASARGVWLRTFDAWCPGAALTVLSYDQVRIATAAGVPSHKLLIVDEAHYCSSPKAQRTREVAKLLQRAPRAWLLSGTPMRNNPLELWAALRALWPDVLSAFDVLSRTAFLNEFCVTAPQINRRWGPKIVGARNPERLRDLLSRVMLRRRLDDVALDLPPLRWETLDLETDETAADLLREAMAALGTDEYEALCEALAAGDLPPDSPHVATMRRYVGVAKAPAAAVAIADELGTGLPDKVVVMAYHTHVMDVLERALTAYGVVRVDGATRDRDAAERAFQTDPAVRVFLGQLTAAGTAITLTAGHEVVLVEQMWSPLDNVQAVKRVHRIGQEYPCRARMCVLPGTIDEQVVRTHQRKLKMIGEIVHL